MQLTFPETIDSTMLVLFRACPHKFLLSHCANLSTIDESVDLLFGGAIAKGLEVARKSYHIGGMDARKAENHGTNAALAYYGNFVPQKDTAKTWEGLLLTMREYFTRWPLDQDPARPIDNKAIEFSFAWDIPEALRPDGRPYIYSGRLDQLADLQGLTYVEDEKTTGQAFPYNWHEQWEIRNQFMGYVWAAQRAGYNVERALVRGICVQKTKISFLPAFAHYPPYMIERWYKQLVRDLNKMTQHWLELERTGDISSFDRNLADACTSWGKPCMFKLPCTSEVPQDWLSANYSHRVWDPTAHNPFVPVKEEAA